MHRTLISLSFLVLAGCASTASIEFPLQQLQANESPTTRDSLKLVRQLDVRPTPHAEEWVCEMAVVTGTRIAERRCYARNTPYDEEADEALQDRIYHLRREQLQLNEEYLKSHSSVCCEFTRGY